MERIRRVAPFTGAWIETQQSCDLPLFHVVAPFTGAWIETPERVRLITAEASRTLYGCVD